MAAIIKKFYSVIGDALLIHVAVLTAFFLRFEGSTFTDHTNNLFFALWMFPAVSTALLLLLGLYRNIKRYARLEDATKIVVAITISTIVQLIYFSRRSNTVSWSVHVLIWLLSVMLVGGVRMVNGTYRGYIHNVLPVSRKAKRVLIIGGGDAGAMVIKELLVHKELMIKPVAIIDDDEKKLGSRIYGVPIVGNRNAIIDTVKRRNVHEIIIAMPSVPKPVIREIIEICKKTKCKLKTLPGVYELIDDQVTIQQIRDVDIEDLLGREPIKADILQISQYIKNQVILVTGGGGSIGSELCRQIATIGPKKLLILDIYENSVFYLQQQLISSYPELDMEVIIASIQDKSRIFSIFERYRPDVVFHAAAHKHVPLMEANPTEAIKNNIFGTYNVAEASDKYGVKRFVLISTDKAVNPTNIMGATKRVAEMVVQAMNKQSRTEFVAVRFGNVLGSNGSVLTLFKEQIAKGGPVTVTHPEVTRFFMTIPEAVQLVIQAGALAKGGEIFVLDMGQPVRIMDLARDYIRLSGFEPDKDIKIQITGLRPGEKLYEEIMMSEEGLQATAHNKIFIVQPTFFDLQKIRSELNQLADVLITGENADMIKFLKRLVPTYNQAVNGNGGA